MSAPSLVMAIVCSRETKEHLGGLRRRRRARRCGVAILGRQAGDRARLAAGGAPVPRPPGHARRNGSGWVSAGR